MTNRTLLLKTTSFTGRSTYLSLFRYIYMYMYICIYILCTIYTIYPIYIIIYIIYMYIYMVCNKYLDAMFVCRNVLSSELWLFGAKKHVLSSGRVCKFASSRLSMWRVVVVVLFVSCGPVIFCFFILLIYAFFIYIL